MTKEPGKLVLVEWRDSCSPSASWSPPNIGEGYGVSVCFTVGWVLRRDKDCLILAGSHNEEMVGEVVAIPAECVVKITSIKRAR